MKPRRSTKNGVLRPRQKFGKFRVIRRIAQGGFADVYRAYDTVEGIHVALKMLHAHMIADRALDDFAKEARIMAKLDHPNILPIKNASYIEDKFVIVYPLGEKTLGDRIANRLSVKSALDYADQMLSALAFAHRKHVIHCDIKPENFILFPGDRLKLADFGIAKLASRFTMSASGSGTVGYVAPEQAMGKPSLRSDIFSTGLIIYRMLSGRLPSWPFEWPLPGSERLRKKVRPEFVAFLRKSLEVDDRKRFPNASQMQRSFQRLKMRAENPASRRRRRRTSRNGADWRAMQLKDFRRRFARPLQANHHCGKCRGPISESMQSCPWCGNQPKTFRGQTRFPARCRYCRRGMKLDWRFCPHCYSRAQGPRSDRSFSDVRYSSTCTSCREPLMPFMRYCPWCRRKVTRKWKIEGAQHKCKRCGWGVLRDFWSRCPWCNTSMRK